MAIGTVKWFSAEKGYGFIEQDAGGKDIFVHVSALNDSELDELREGQRIGFEVETGRNGRPQATKLKKA